MGVLRNPFKDLHRLSLGLPDGMKVDLGGCPVLVPQKALDGSEVDILPVQDRSTQVPEGMEAKIPDFRVLT